MTRTISAGTYVFQVIELIMMVLFAFLYFTWTVTFYMKQEKAPRNRIVGQHVEINILDQIDSGNRLQRMKLPECFLMFFRFLCLIWFTVSVGFLFYSFNSKYGSILFSFLSLTGLNIVMMWFYYFFSSAYSTPTLITNHKYCFFLRFVISSLFQFVLVSNFSWGFGLFLLCADVECYDSVASGFNIANGHVINTILIFIEFLLLKKVRFHVFDFFLYVSFVCFYGFVVDIVYETGEIDRYPYGYLFDIEQSGIWGVMARLCLLGFYLISFFFLMMIEVIKRWINWKVERYCQERDLIQKKIPSKKNQEEEEDESIKPFIVTDDVLDIIEVDDGMCKGERMIARRKSPICDLFSC